MFLSPHFKRMKRFSSTFTAHLAAVSAASVVSMESWRFAATTRKRAPPAKKETTTTRRASTPKPAARRTSTPKTAARRTPTPKPATTPKPDVVAEVEVAVPIMRKTGLPRMKKVKRPYKVRRAWDYTEGYARQMDADDVLAMPDDAPIEDTMEYLEQVTRTGCAEKHLREQMTMSMRMAAGECCPEVPSISFLYALLRKNPSLMHETYARRIRIAVEEWNRLSETRRETFAKNPLKGIVF